MRVLFADDDSIARALLAAVLADLGHDAVGVEDGEAAWAAYDRDPVPLVILDINMPYLDGLDVCRRIRAHARGRETFVLVVTARDGREDLTAVLHAGADDYVTKPSSPENLRARLEIAGVRVHQNERQRAAESALARSRWLAGIGETTIALEHEINNPLSALLGHTELLLMEEVEPGRRDQLLIIQQQAARIADVVRRLARLKNPQTVEYLAGAQMIDLSGEGAGR
ncbi:MAG: response regulator receiver sensor signal transduction histidine kinase [Gemmatimonadetes bacterium]|jgi:DNA-binding response OmpR family regulator|nr:response regulator receiver sensor signal transduction histidine kinase [Gemmatimonadota bacterium]